MFAIAEGESPLNQPLSVLNCMTYALYGICARAAGKRILKAGQRRLPCYQLFLHGLCNVAPGLQTRAVIRLQR